MPSKPLTKEDALLKMASLCARSEQCEFDIARKLYTKRLPADDVRWVIDELTGRRFLDSARFARSFARDKVRFSSWGRRKISVALRAKRIPEATVSEALAEIEPSDYDEAASRVARQGAVARHVAA